MVLRYQIFQLDDKVGMNSGNTIFRFDFVPSRYIINGLE